VIDTAAAAADVAPAVNQHRILIFCQLKSMLDIVEHDLLQYVFCLNCKNSSVHYVHRIINVHCLLTGNYHEGFSSFS